MMDPSISIAPKLLKIVDFIERDREETASLWIAVDSVKSVFKSHKISTVKFKNSYGIPIIEYFIAVVREEKEAGNCPIMSKLVNFLLEKNITPQNVFDICMGLRKTLVSSLFKKGLVDEDPTAILEEIATLFDANLSGVLAVFTGYYAKKQEKIQKSILQQKKFNQTLKIINFINTKIIIVQSGRIVMGNKSFFETLGVKNLKELYQKHEYNFSFMKGSSCPSNNCSSEEITEWLQMLSYSKKPFKTEIYHHLTKADSMYSGRVTTLPDTEPAKYIISLNSISAHLEDEAIMKRNLEHDSLTDLYNYVKFINLLGVAQRKARLKNSQLALIIVDIPMLKEINRDKGMDGGDQIIVKVSEIIREFADENMIYARLEGSRFGILTSYSLEQEVYDFSFSLAEKLNMIPQRQTVSLSGFDLSDSVHNSILRVNVLSDSLYLEDNNIITDFKNVELYEKLSDQERFTQKLKNLRKIRTTIYYKELAIAANSKVVRIEKDKAVIGLSNKEFCIASVDQSIYLDFPNFGIVKANVYSLDEKKMTVTLHRFILKKHTPLKREKLRVKADDDIQSTILSSGISINADLLDVNEQYIAIALKRIRNLLEGMPISLDISLPIEDGFEYFSSEATVQSIQKVKGYYKVVVLCHLDGVNKNILQNYIAGRQIQIIHELKERDSADDYSI